MNNFKSWLKENFFFIVFIVMTFVICNIQLPYYVMAPGGIIEVNDRIEVENKNNMSGTLNLLYVSEYKATVASAFLSLIFKDWDLEKLEEVQISDETAKDIDQRNKVMLENSIQNAIFVAYQKANKEIKIKDRKNIVVGSLYDNNLEVGDEIISINGINIENIESVKTILKSTEVGKNLLVKIIRDKKEQEVLAQVKEVEGNKVVGVVIITNYDYELNPDIKLNFKKTEGGSSGGLMIALNIYNAITNKDITNNHKVAGTGTIDAYGNIGEIDGVKYKIMGAYNNNMELVLVPKNNYKEAIEVVKEKGYNMKIVSVETFDEALNYLKEYK